MQWEHVGAMGSGTQKQLFIVKNWTWYSVRSVMRSCQGKKQNFSSHMLVHPGAQQLDLRRRHRENAVRVLAGARARTQQVGQLLVREP